MLAFIAGHTGMLIAMWVILIITGLNILLNLIQGLRGTANFASLASTATQPLLYDVFPLILLSLLTAIDPTHILVLIWYYVAAVLIAVRGVFSLGTALKR